MIFYGRRQSGILFNECHRRSSYRHSDVSKKHSFPQWIGNLTLLQLRKICTCRKCYFENKFSNGIMLWEWCDCFNLRLAEKPWSAKLNEKCNEWLFLLSWLTANWNFTIFVNVYCKNIRSWKIILIARMKMTHIQIIFQLHAKFFTFSYQLFKCKSSACRSIIFKWLWYKNKWKT